VKLVTGTLDQKGDIHTRKQASQWKNGTHTSNTDYSEVRTVSTSRSFYIDCDYRQ